MRSGGDASFDNRSDGVARSYGRIISPCTEFTNDVWHVLLSGDVYDYRNVDLSYGRGSPGTYGSDYAYFVDRVGDAFDGSYGVSGSYGIMLSAHGWFKLYMEWMAKWRC